MEDEDILKLYQERNEAALEETTKKYGSMLKHIAMSILKNEEETGECFNDVLLSAWNQIPPNMPAYFSAYLAKSIRYLAFGRLDYQNAKKRKAEVVELSTEIERDILKNPDMETVISERELSGLISRFLKEQALEQRIVFVQRYWYGNSIEEIAENRNLRRGTVKSMLSRMRKKLKIYLEKEGIFL